MVRGADSRCPSGHYSSQNTSIKVQTQDSTAKKSKLKESRLKDLKPVDGKTSVLPRTNKLRKIFCQNKKKEYLKKKRDRKNSTPAIGDKVIKNEKKQNN